MQALQQLAEAGDAPPGRAMRKMSSSATAPGTATAHWNKGVIFTKNAVQFGPSMPSLSNTKGYSSTYLAMGFANVRAGTQKRRGVFGYPPEHERIP